MHVVDKMDLEANSQEGKMVWGWRVRKGLTGLEKIMVLDGGGGVNI